MRRDFGCGGVATDTLRYPGAQTGYQKRLAKAPSASAMIYLVVQLTYVPGYEAEGAEYERTVLGYFREHGGEVLGAFRPAPWANGTRAADEVQLLRIATREQIDAYMKAERRLALVPIRDRSIATTEIVMSEEPLAR
jgi:hypothetical protein